MELPINQDNRILKNIDYKEVATLPKVLGNVACVFLRRFLAADLARILETQPWETRNCLEMSHGLMPSWASSTILRRIELGKGRPLTKTPPSWFISP